VDHPPALCLCYSQHKMVRRIFREFVFLELAAVTVSVFCTAAQILTFWALSLLYWPERLFD
jgi:hypothetical protein